MLNNCANCDEQNKECYECYLLNTKDAYQTLESMPDDSAQQEVYLEACIHNMDDDLRESLHGLYKDDADLLKKYCELHQAKFNQPYIIN